MFPYHLNLKGSRWRFSNTYEFIIIWKLLGRKNDYNPGNQKVTLNKFAKIAVKIVIEVRNVKYD